MPDQSTILSLPHILPSQAQKHVTHNEALRLLDVMVQLSVLQRSLNVPPVSPVLGDRYIVAASPAPTGAWAGHGRDIALWNGTAWEFFEALKGWRAYVGDEAAIVVYDGTNWLIPSGGAGSFSQLGVAMSADATNKLAVLSEASLFTNPAGSHRLAINKGDNVETASTLFQQDYQTFAEIGLLATNDLSIKVSANGTTFSTAITVDKDNGRATIEQPMRLIPAAGDASAPTDGLLWYNSTTGKFRARQGGASVDLIAAGSIPPTVFADAVFRIEDNVDATKKAAFEVSGLTTGTTRTYTLPDTSGEVALLAGSQTFSGDKTFNGTATFRDNNLFLTDLADPSRVAQFSLDGITPGTTRVISLPNASGALAITANAAQAFVGQTTFTNPTLVFGNSSAASTTEISTGPATTGLTKAIMIGTNGLSGSTTTVNIGSSVGGALGQTVISSPTLTVGSTAVTMATATSVGMAAANVTAGQMGIGGATADAANRLSVSAPGVLFNHAGTSMEATLNKATTGDNARVSFMTGFSTRAQFGLSGTNDFSLRVSADGSSFNDGMSVAAASGSMTLAKPMILTGQASDPGSPVDGTLWYNSTTAQLKARINAETLVLDGQRELPFLVPVSGEFILASMGSGTTTGTVAGAAGRIEMYPYNARADIAVTGIALNCTTAVVSALAKFAVYNSDSFGRPNTKLLETADLDLGTVGVKTATVSQALLAGRTYWLALRYSSTATVSLWGLNATPDINGGTPVTTARKVIRRTLTYGTAAPTTWGFLSSEISNVAAPAIWLRV